MRTSLGVAVGSIVAVLAGCGSSSDPATARDTNDASADGTRADADAVSPGDGADAGGGDAGGAADGGATDGAPASARDGGTVMTVTMTMSEFTVQPTGEIHECQGFKNPFGRDVDLVRFDGTKSADISKFSVFNMAPETGRAGASPLGPCAGEGLEFYPSVYMSQWGATHYVETYPRETMGYPFAKSNGLMLYAHVLNTGSQPLSPTATITLTAAAGGTVSVHVGHIFLDNTSFTVPSGIAAGSEQWFANTSTPITAEDFTIFRSWGRMHSYATEIQASLGNGSPFFDDAVWNDTAVVDHLPPLAVPAGTPVTWQCKYHNETGAPLSFSDDSLMNNVVCEYYGEYYPADPSSVHYPDVMSVFSTNGPH